MSRRGTLSAALAVLLTASAVFARPSMALYSKGSSLQGCWVSLGFCINPNCLFPGTLWENVCKGGGPICLCSSGGFAPTAFLGPHGGHVQVSGHVVCSEGAVADLRVTITQRGTGAVAEGTTRIACTGHEAPWEIQGATVGRGAFSAGPATACGLLEVNGQNDPPDAFQWCRDEIELLEP